MQFQLQQNKLNANLCIYLQVIDHNNIIIVGRITNKIELSQLLDILAYLHPAHQHNIMICG